MKESEQQKFCPISEAMSCRGLWQAILLLALRDALSLNKDDVLHQREAYTWIKNGNKDFQLVCDHAGYDPKMVCEGFMRIYTQKRIKIGRRR